jgi:plastocyanin
MEQRRAWSAGPRGSVVRASRVGTKVFGWGLGLALVAVGLPAVARAHGPTIEITHSEMKPSLLNLYVGTTVHFVNTVEMPGGHVVVEKNGRFEGPPLEHEGDDWHYTFEEEGVFEIFIKQHPGAKARIVVVPRPTPGP